MRSGLTSTRRVNSSRVRKASIRTAHARLAVATDPCKGCPPPILADDIGERDAANWPKPPHGVADRQQGIRLDAGRQAERGLGLLLELNALAASSMFCTAG
jgi:hypothetical protein